MCVCTQKKNKSTGFDKPLHDMERKLYCSVKNNQSTENSDEIEIGETVAVLNTYMNRYVRGQLKEIASNGSVHVWLPDYGVPIIAKRNEMVKIPPIYAKMNSKCPRIQVGGLINCVPAESNYQVDVDKMMVTETANWSKKANEIVQAIIAGAVKVTFDKVKTFKQPHRDHNFGQLKCQKPDGSWVDLNNSLSNAMVAKITSDDWLKKVQQMETISQSEWKTNYGVNDAALNAKVVVLKNVSVDISRNEVTSNQSVQSITVATNPNGNAASVTVENESLAEKKANKKATTKNVKITVNAEEQTGPKKVHGMRNSRGMGYMVRGRGRGFGHQLPPNYYTHYDNYRGYYPRRMPYHWEQQYFEQCLHPSSSEKKQKQSSSSSASSTADDGSNDNKQKPHDETLPEKTDSEKSTDAINQANAIESNATTDVNENKIKHDTDATGSGTEKDTAPADAAIFADNSTNNNEDEATA